MRFLAATLLALACAAALRADEEPAADPQTGASAPQAASENSAPPKWFETISISGFIDGYYAWNVDQPRSHENFVPGTGTTAKRADEINLNLATLEIVRDPKPVGFHLSVVAGSGADVVHAAEPEGSGVGRHVYNNVYQASVSYNAPIGKGLLLEAGIYPSHIGFEGFFSKDNWNYTRGWMGEFSPYYQTGIKASYGFNGHWSAQLHVVNGWQTIADNNEAKSVGTQIAYTGGRLSAAFNTLVGPELPNDNKHLRALGDLVATYKPVSPLSLGFSLDRGRQDLPGNNAANWLCASVWSRYAVDDRHAFAMRAEKFRDPDNGISGFAQTLTGATLTYEYRPAPSLILKLEGRHDHSTAPVFAKGNGATTRSEALALLSAVVTF
jgi:hypothetical protein